MKKIISVPAEELCTTLTLEKIAKNPDELEKLKIAFSCVSYMRNACSKITPYIEAIISKLEKKQGELKNKSPSSENTEHTLLYKALESDISIARALDRSIQLFLEVLDVILKIIHSDEVQVYYYEKLLISRFPNGEDTALETSFLSNAAEKALKDLNNLTMQDTDEEFYKKKAAFMTYSKEIGIFFAQEDPKLRGAYTGWSKSAFFWSVALRNTLVKYNRKHNLFTHASYIYNFFSILNKCTSFNVNTLAHLQVLDRPDLCPKLVNGKLKQEDLEKNIERATSPGYRKILLSSKLQKL